MAESLDVIFMLSLISFYPCFLKNSVRTLALFFNIILQGIAKFPPVFLKKTVTAGKGTALDSRSFLCYTIRNLSSNLPCNIGFSTSINSFFFRVSILDQMKDRILLPLIHSSSVFLVH